MSTVFTAPPGAEAFAQMMQQAWEQWQASLKGQTAALNQVGDQTIERAMTGLKHYFALLESMQSRLGDGLDPAQWRKALEGIFEQGQPFVRAFTDAGQLAGGGPQAWMQSWQRLADASAFGTWRDLLAMPSIGFAREHQEHWQRLARDMLDYQQQLQRYNQLLVQAGKRGAEKFEAKLAERMEPGRQIDSLRALYDLWVDAAEEGFQEVALSAEWSEVYGALVDAQMRVRAGVQHQVERISREFGVPTRSEVDTLGKRLHELRRQVRMLETRLAAAGIHETPTAQESKAGPTRGASGQGASAAAKAAPARKPATKRH